jgi:hypothetical protein
VAGGPGAFAPEPLVPFFDVFCVGDGNSCSRTFSLSSRPGPGKMS